MLTETEAWLGSYEFRQFVSFFGFNVQAILYSRVEWSIPYLVAVSIVCPQQWNDCIVMAALCPCQCISPHQ